MNIFISLMATASVSRLPESIFAGAVIAVAVLALHAAVAVFLAVSATVTPAGYLAVFTLAVVTAAVGALHNTRGPGATAPLAIPAAAYVFS